MAANTKTHLVTVPSFIFDQTIDGCYEMSIQVAFYNGTIELTQDGRCINISTELVKDLFKEITGHLPEALDVLEKR